MTNSNVSVTSANGVSFDLESEELLVDGEVRRLQAKEVKLLEYFLDHANRIVPRSDLLTDVWGYDASVDTRTVDIHVSHLRKKLNAGKRQGIIKTIHGVGYRFTIV